MDLSIGGFAPLLRNFYVDQHTDRPSTATANEETKMISTPLQLPTLIPVPSSHSTSLTYSFCTYV